jgi:hypothetical protein
MYNTGGVQKLVASGTVTAGDLVVCAAAGQVSTLAAVTTPTAADVTNTRAIVGVALTTATNGNIVDVADGEADSCHTSTRPARRRMSGELETISRFLQSPTMIARRTADAARAALHRRRPAHGTLPGAGRRRPVRDRRVDLRDGQPRQLSRPAASTPCPCSARVWRRSPPPSSGARTRGHRRGDQAAGDEPGQPGPASSSPTATSSSSTPWPSRRSRRRSPRQRRGSGGLVRCDGAQILNDVALGGRRARPEQRLRPGHGRHQRRERTPTRWRKFAAAATTPGRRTRRQPGRSPGASRRSCRCVGSSSPNLPTAGRGARSSTPSSSRRHGRRGPGRPGLRQRPTPR